MPHIIKRESKHFKLNTIHVLYIDLVEFGAQ